MIDWEAPGNEARASERAARSEVHSAQTSCTGSGGEPGRVDLREIAFEAVSATPLPETWESDTEFAWLEFDAAKVELDLTTGAGRAEYATLITARSTKG